MNCFSYYLLAKIYWPIDLFCWAIVLLAVYLPYARYCSNKEIGTFSNFVYFFLFFAITILGSIGWIWLIVNGIIAIWESNIAKTIALALISSSFLFIVFEDFIIKIFTRKRFDANLKTQA